MGDYDDIIGRTPPANPRRKPMPMSARAAQFAPFSALSGLEEALASVGDAVSDTNGQQAPNACKSKTSKRDRNA